MYVNDLRQGTTIDLGYAWATVHARTVVQKYEGVADWTFLADLTRRYPGFPILGAGDTFTAAAIVRMLAETGVRGVAVARGAIGNPWIFREARRLLAGEAPSPPTLQEQREVLLEQHRLALRFRGESYASRTQRTLGIKMSRHHPMAPAVAEAFISCRSREDWWATVERFYPGK